MDAQAGKYDLQKAKIYAFQGIDRISSSMMLESTPQNIYFFPFITTPLINAINVIDDESGALNKRFGGPVYLDNPDSQPVQNLIQYTNAATGISQQLRVSGTSIYRYAYSGNTWGTSIKTLSGNNIRMRHASLNGYLHLSNGTDPLMYYDGTNFFNVTNGSVTNNLNGNINATTHTITVNSTAGFDLTAGYLQIDSEVMLYTATSSTTFTIQSPSGSNGLIDGRGYAGTTATTHSSGAVVTFYFGTPPTTPKIVYQIKGRLWAFNLGITGGSSAFQVASARGRVTDSRDWIITAQSTSVNGTATGTLDPGSSQVYFLNPDDGQQITAVGYVNGNVVVAKGQSLYVIQLDQYGNPASNYQISGQFGTLSQESMVNLDSNLFYFNQYGVFTTDSTKPNLLSYQINDLATGVPASNLTSVVGAKHNFMLLFSVGSTTEAFRFGGNTYNNAVLVYNYITSDWFLWQYPFAINIFSEMFDSTGTLQLFYGDTNGNTYQFTPNTFSDGGKDIPVVIETRFFFYKEAGKRKDYRATTAICDNGASGSLLGRVIDEYIENWIPIMKLPHYVNTNQFPLTTIRGRGIAYKVIEASSGDFRFRAIEQEYEDAGF